MDFDELWLEPGCLRPHLRLLGEHLSQSPSVLSRLETESIARLEAHGVTYNLSGFSSARHQSARNQAWKLDSIPHIIPRAEFEQLSLGLQQRARLLNAIADDIYSGNSQLLSQGVIPKEVILSSPDYLRSCVGWTPKEARVGLGAADIARHSDGKFHIYSDRCGATTGQGFALQNRLVLGRLLEELFERCEIERLASYFQIVKDYLHHVSPRSAEASRIVLLSPGTQDESSFEHAYLARYFGLELVEGRDITTRSGQLFLKTLGGLQPLDVLVRRVSDLASDPLELREDSLHGIPGLVNASRRGQIALINPLGSAILDNPVMKVYSEACCKFLLKEELLLPVVETHWLGDDLSWSKVQASPSSYIIKHAYGEMHGAVIDLRNMSNADIAERLLKVESRRRNYVAERWPERSHSATFSNGTFVSRALSMRMFYCRRVTPVSSKDKTREDDYAIMPGGLGHLDERPDGILVDHSLESTSKDVWVERDPEVPLTKISTLLREHVKLQRGGVELPSRLLDDIYWLGRYLERTDMCCRVLRRAFSRGEEEIGESGHESHSAVMTLLRTWELLPSRETIEPSKKDNTSTFHEERYIEQELHTLAQSITDATRPTSLVSMLGVVKNLAQKVKPKLSRDAVLAISRLKSPKYSESNPIESSLESLENITVYLRAVRGAILDNVTRGHAWNFLDMGYRVERVGATLQCIQEMLLPGANQAHMSTLLDIGDSLLTYRSRYRSRLQAAPVVDLLLTDESNPRSVAFQIIGIQRHLTGLPMEDRDGKSKAEKLALLLLTDLQVCDPEELCAGDGQALRDFLEQSYQRINDISENLVQRWFAHASSLRAIAPPQWLANEEDNLISDSSQEYVSSPNHAIPGMKKALS